MTQLVKDTEGQAMNKFWKEQQKKLNPKPTPAPATRAAEPLRPVTRIPLSDIDTEPVKINADVIEAIRKKIDSHNEKPIIVIRTGDRYYAIDGKRRIAAYRALQQPNIPAIVDESTPKQPQAQASVPQPPHQNPQECQGCQVHVQCRAVMKMWDAGARRPSIVRAWIKLADQHCAEMQCLGKPGEGTP
ncbi:MAG: ParB/RepB/Spo0J family partition protein [Methanoregula sp.]